MTGDIVYGTVCDLTCDEGYETVGNVECLPDNSGTWSEFACGKLQFLSHDVNFNHSFKFMRKQWNQ